MIYILTSTVRVMESRTLRWAYHLRQDITQNPGTERSKRTAEDGRITFPEEK
jgi:hypothetical protein